MGETSVRKEQIPTVPLTGFWCNILNSVRDSLELCLLVWLKYCRLCSPWNFFHFSAFFLPVLFHQNHHSYEGHKTAFWCLLTMLKKEHILQN